MPAQNQGLISGAQKQSGGNEQMFGTPTSAGQTPKQSKIGQMPEQGVAPKMPILKAPGPTASQTAAPQQAPQQPSPTPNQPHPAGIGGAPSRIKQPPAEILAGINTALTSKQDTLSNLAQNSQLSPGYGIG